MRTAVQPSTYNTWRARHFASSFYQSFVFLLATFTSYSLCNMMNSFSFRQVIMVYYVAYNGFCIVMHANIIGADGYIDGTVCFFSLALYHSSLACSFFSLIQFVLIAWTRIFYDCLFYHLSHVLFAPGALTLSLSPFRHSKIEHRFTYIDSVSELARKLIIHSRNDFLGELKQFQ